MLTVDYDSVIKRWLQATHATSELELSRKLGMAPSTISVYRRRDSIPYRLLVEWCGKNRISLDWMLFGTSADRLRRPED